MKTQEKSHMFPHKTRLLAELQNLKKVLRKKAFSVDGTQEERKQFHECLRVFQRQLSEKAKQKTSLHQEKQFNKNRWKFVKQAVNGTLDKETQQVGFSREEDNLYYPSTYSSPPPFDPSHSGPIHWFPHILVNHTPFNTEPFRPRDVKLY